MRQFEFHNTTKVFFGENQLDRLAEEIAVFGKRILVTYGGGSIKKNGLYDKVMEQLGKKDFAVFELSGIEPNPRHTTVNKGAKICKEEKIDVILAIGGGSTIDCSKAIAAAAYYEGDSWDLVMKKAPIVQAIPIITIPTIAATGSEMDDSGIISNIDAHEKRNLHHESLFPKVSFLIPSNTFSVNAYQTATGSVDILSHIFDCYYFTLQNRMNMQKEVMEVLIKNVIHYAPIAIKEPKNAEARENLMWIASWALNGFLKCGVSQVASCHDMEHELSAYYDITHGHGLAILTPRWLEYVLDEETAPVIAEFGYKIFELPSSGNILEDAKNAIRKLSDFFYKELKLASKLSELSIDSTYFEAMAKNACRKGSIKGGFKELYVKDVVEIYKMCL